MNYRYLENLEKRNELLNYLQQTHVKIGITTFFTVKSGKAGRYWFSWQGMFTCRSESVCSYYISAIAGGVT